MQSHALCQANLDRLVAQLKPLARSCSLRELAILATAIYELREKKQVDCFKELLVIQVAPGLKVNVFLLNQFMTSSFKFIQSVFQSIVSG